MHIHILRIILSSLKNETILVFVTTWVCLEGIALYNPKVNRETNITQFHPHVGHSTADFREAQSGTAVAKSQEEVGFERNECKNVIPDRKSKFWHSATQRAISVRRILHCVIQAAKKR